ncbi:ribonuclease H-like domain-containing protein [Tanacetum coccineum]
MPSAMKPGNIQKTLRTTPSGTASNVQCYNCSEKGHYAYNCPKPRVRDSKYFMEQMLLAKQDEAGVILTDEHNDFLFADASRMEEIEELSANICLMARIQPANFDSDEGPSYDSAFLSDVLTPSTSYVNPLFAKDTKQMRTRKLSGTDNQEKDEKQRQNDKTGLGMEKTVKDKAKSKPESQSSQKVNRKVNWSKSKSTQVNPEAKVTEI